MADIKRSLVNVTTDKFKNVDSDSLATRYDTMLTNITNMITNNGPTYSVWIYFQLGTKNPIVFNTSSTNKKQNLIASLNIAKGGSGVANTFTLKVRYDAFNFGQNTTDQIEALDEYIADAMSVDWNSDDEEAKLNCVLQYGYNGTGNDDNKLVSPQYNLLLTNANSNVQYDSGISEYTFEGVSKSAGDCDFTTNFEKKSNVGVMTTVANVLYKYYGKSGNPPNGVDSDVQPEESTLNYYIDIPKDLVDDQYTAPSIGAATDVSPWQYCLDLLSQYPLTKTQSQDSKYQDLKNMDYDEIPRYTMYITDNKDRPTIHVAHITPKESKDNITLNYKFTWSLQNKNIVTQWNPEVDLYQYLIRKFNYKREVEKIKNGEVTSDDEDAEKNGVTETIEEKLQRVQQDELLEMYNATLTIVGIPADPPLTAEIKIMPRVLQSVSRTAGVYIITDCEDNISTNGIYTTTLKLFRTRALDEKEWKTDSSTQINTSTSSTTAQQEKEKKDATATGLDIQEEAKKISEKVDTALNDLEQKIKKILGGK